VDVDENRGERGAAEIGLQVIGSAKPARTTRVNAIAVTAKNRRSKLRGAALVVMGASSVTRPDKGEGRRRREKGEGRGRREKEKGNVVPCPFSLLPC
jgi:hypothetical protein